jgi:hypothetical protein
MRRANGSVESKNGVTPHARCATKCCAGAVSLYFHHFNYKIFAKYISRDDANVRAGRGAEFRELLGEFDPEAFSVAAAEARLREWFAPRRTRKPRKR